MGFGSFLIDLVCGENGRRGGDGEGFRGEGEDPAAAAEAATAEEQQRDRVQGAAGAVHEGGFRDGEGLWRWLLFKGG